MKKISININGRNYDIDVEKSFAAFLEAQIDKHLNRDANNDHKKLLEAYIKMNYELFEIHNALEESVKKLTEYE